MAEKQVHQIMSTDPHAAVAGHIMIRYVSSLQKLFRD